MLSFDGLPRTQPNHQFTNTWSSNTPLNNFISNPMRVSQSTTQWNAQPHSLTKFDDQSANDYYDYSTVTQGNEGHGSFPRSLSHVDVPRTWPLPYEPTMAYDGSGTSKTYEPSAYMIQPIKNNSEATLAFGPGLGYNAQESPRDFARLSISLSPKMEEGTLGSGEPSLDKSPGFFDLSRESSNDSGDSSQDIPVGDVEDYGAGEPYAKLIHRALMSAPNHSMVLQEIYQWFRDHTAKGSSDTKGWMNSIRHNLSMNAVRKFHPCL
jgi:hypothetical protein